MTVLESHSRTVEEGPDAYGPPWSGCGSGWLSYISPWPLQYMPNPAARVLCDNKVSSCPFSALAFLFLRWRAYSCLRAFALFVPFAWIWMLSP